MKIRSIPDLQNFPAYRGKFIVDTFRGQIRIRSWPRKQSAATKRKNGNQIRWFTAAREMAKWAEPNQIIISKDATKGTGLYPSDLQLMAASGNLIPRIAASPKDYTKWIPRVEPVSFTGARLPLAANQTKVANVQLTLVWGLPEFQSTEFWVPGDPTKISIPPGIAKVQLTFGWRSLWTNDSEALGIIIDQSGNLLAGNRMEQATNANGTVPTGPIAVNEGDWFTADVAAGIAGTVVVNKSTFFSIEVLETT